MDSPVNRRRFLQSAGTGFAAYQRIGRHTQDQSDASSESGGAVGLPPDAK